MSIPKSSVSYSRVSKTLQVWALATGFVALLLICLFKAYTAPCKEGPIRTIGPVYLTHVDLLEGPNPIEIKEAMEHEGWRETRTERDWERNDNERSIEDIS